MSLEKALEYAKAARRSAPPEIYKLARNFEKAVEELVVELGGPVSPSEPAKPPPGPPAAGRRLFR